MLKKFFVVITNLINNLKQYHLLLLIVIYAFIPYCSFQICSHIHPKSFDAGLISTRIWAWIRNSIQPVDVIIHPCPNFNGGQWRFTWTISISISYKTMDVIQVLILVNVCQSGADPGFEVRHYNDVIMGPMASQITSLAIVYSAVYSGADQRKHQSSASLAFVRGIHRGPVNSPHKWSVTRKMFPIFWWRHHGVAQTWMGKLKSYV